MPAVMTARRTIGTLLAAAATLLTATAQRPRTGIRALHDGPKPVTGIAYYDVDRIYDTLPALFYDDADYTPEGRRAWNTERYRRKIRNTAAVIDSMALEIVALWGVENEAVVRDLVTACRGDYSYIHRTLNTLDGMDFALLYYGDRFFPHYVEPGRRYLYVEGTLRNDTLGLVLCADTRMAAWVAGDLREERPAARLVVLGRSSSMTDPERYGLHDATARAEHAGRGTAYTRKGWVMRDRLLVDTALTTVAADVYARRFMIDPRSGKPFATYNGRAYCGGFSFSLPVYVYIR